MAQADRWRWGHDDPRRGDRAGVSSAGVRKTSYLAERVVQSIAASITRRTEHARCLAKFMCVGRPRTRRHRPPSRHSPHLHKLQASLYFDTSGFRLEHPVPAVQRAPPLRPLRLQTDYTQSLRVAAALILGDHIGRKLVGSTAIVVDGYARGGCIYALEAERTDDVGEGLIVRFEMAAAVVDRQNPPLLNGDCTSTIYRHTSRGV